MVVVTMGGVGWQDDALQATLGRDDPWVVIPGSPQRAQRGRLIHLPAQSEFYHPDLIHAADVVVGKLGYSTLAEAWAAGCRSAISRGHAFPSRHRSKPGCGGSCRVDV